MGTRCRLQIGGSTEHVGHSDPMASQGLKAIAEALGEEWVTNGGVLLPIRMR